MAFMVRVVDVDSFFLIIDIGHLRRSKLQRSFGEGSSTPLLLRDPLEFAVTPFTMLGLFPPKPLSIKTYQNYAW